ncbi:MAG TPA: NAD(P)-dependent oxidoreductase [Casimicrobiaceae bacterium]|nr:NAD(P)-dependent oxidoreductase [Casimicrobiaceae bacterium]
MKRIVVTGAAGDAASQLRPHLLVRGYRLHCIDIGPTTTSRGETAVVADVTDRAAMTREFAGMDAVVHLAACTTDADWPDQVKLSVEGTIEVFEAARACGIERVVYASTNHVVGLYPRPPHGPARGSREVLLPDSRYGVAKAFGESVSALFAYKYAMRVLVIRIGNVNSHPVDRRRLGIWLSPRDFAQLVALGIEHPSVRFEIVYGISDRTGRHYDNATAYALGFRPQDGVVEPEIEAKVLREDPPPAAGSAAAASVTELSLGGSFAAEEFVGSAARLMEAMRKPAPASCEGGAEPG